MRNVIEEIAAERKRQIEQEGWSLEHDDKHRSGELAMAAAIYASPRADLKVIAISSEYGLTLTDPWPWWNEYEGARNSHRYRAWYKPKDRRRDLIRAAALITAEIERLDRAGIKNET